MEHWLFVATFCQMFSFVRLLDGCVLGLNVEMIHVAANCSLQLHRNFISKTQICYLNGNPMRSRYLSAGKKFCIVLLILDFSPSHNYT